MKLSDQIARHNNSLTLQELKIGNNSLVFECVVCGMQRNLDIETLIKEHGGETRVAYIKRTTGCQGCN